MADIKTPEYLETKQPFGQMPVLEVCPIPIVVIGTRADDYGCVSGRRHPRLWCARPRAALFRLISPRPAPLLVQSPALSVASSSTSMAAPQRTLSFHPHPTSPRPRASKSPRVSKLRTLTRMQALSGRRRTCCPSLSQLFVVFGTVAEGCVVKVPWSPRQRGKGSGAGRRA